MTTVPLERVRAVELTPVLVAAFAASTAAAWLVVHPEHVRLAIAAALITAAVGLSSVSPKALLVALSVWTVLLGLVRRLISGLVAVDQADPLLLVAPAALGILVLIAAHRRAFKDLTALAKTVLVLNVLVVLGAFNPAQRSVTAGIAGLLFLLVPVAGFWIGRSLVVTREVLAAVVRWLVPLGAAAAVYGLLQTLNGFPRWDADWARENEAYASLYIFAGERVLRPFGTLSSAAEYAFLLAGVAVAVGASWLAGRSGRIPIAALLALLGAGLALAAVRTVFITLAAALALMVGARRGLGLARSAFLLALAIASVTVFASYFVPQTAPGSSAQALVEHQFSGLANPLDPAESTLLVHLTLVREGVASALDEPLGLGTSVVTLAGSRFGGVEANTEADPSNVAVALGLPGFLVYVLLFALAVTTVYRLARHRRDWLSLTALGFLVVTSFQWLNGGHYAVTWVAWLLLGWADREFLTSAGVGRHAAVSAGRKDEARLPSA